VSFGFDERREIWRLLKHLSPAKRIEWLKWCCQQVSQGAVQTKVIESKGGHEEVFWDGLSLKAVHGLSLETMGLRLLDMVHRRT
jgi:hypothetical protein